MSISFAALQRSYTHYNTLDTEAIYRSIGWDDVVGKNEWSNTCAVRMHLALLDAGASIPGRFEVVKGPHKGQKIETSQKALAQKLENSTLLGRVQRLRGGTEQYKEWSAALWQKTGVISFQQMPGYAGGHIDLLDARTRWTCSRLCDFTAGQLLFWQVR